MRYMLFVVLVVGWALTSVAYADDQAGLQTGWVEQPSLEVTSNATFSISGQGVTTSLKVESQGPPLVVYPPANPLAGGEYFFIGHKALPVTISHNYPDPLPVDVTIDQAEIRDAAGGVTNAVETNATLEQISDSNGYGAGWVYSIFQASGPDSGQTPQMDNHVRFRPVWVYLEYRYGPDDETHQFHNPFDTNEPILNDLADGPDIMNMTFQVQAEYTDFLTQQRVPEKDIEIRTKYMISHPDLGSMPLYISPWSKPDKDGEAMVDVGSGGEVVPASNTLVVVCPYAVITASVSSEGTGYGRYLSNRVRVDDMRTFKGTLTVKTMDPEGSPVPLVSFLIQGAINEGGTTNSAGEAEIQVNGGGSDTKTVEVVVPPTMTGETEITQIVDGAAPSQLHSQSPAYFVVKYRLGDGSTYATGTTFDDFTLRIFENGVLAAEIEGLYAKNPACVSPQDKATGAVNAYWYPVLPEASAKTYSAQTIWKNDLDEEITLLHPTAPLTIRENRVPALERPFRVHIVGVETPDVLTLKGRGVRTTWARPSGMAAMTKYFETLFPAPVEFTFGPDIKSSDPWYTFGSFRVLSYFLDLERHRSSMAGRPDLIVGICGPGVIGADGLSEPRFRNVVMLDGSALRESYLLHEYMHTLGKLDNYNYETGDDDCGASGNGYDPRTGTRVYNTPGATKPTFQTVMYDHAPRPWMTRSDYDTLLDEATVTMTYDLTGNRVAPTKSRDEVSTAAQEVFYIGAPIMGKQTWSSYNYNLKETWPIFVDWDTPWQPQQSPSPTARALGVVLSNGQTASVRENPYWIGEYDPEDDGNLAAAPLFRIPYDAAVNSITFRATFQDSSVTNIRTITFSPNAPTVSIETPVTGAQLEGDAPVVFHADDTDEGEQLYAWVRMSADGGATWDPVGNWFAIERGRNEFTLPCNDIPQTPDARIRVLVSDGTRSARATVSGLSIDGFSTTPAAQVTPESVNQSVTVGATCLIPVQFTNTGGAELTVTPDTASLPSWITCRQNGEQTVTPGARIDFLYNVDAGTTGSLSTDLSFTTNAPGAPLVTVPLLAQVVSDPTAPVVASLSSDPEGDISGLVASTAPVRFLVREACGRTQLEGTIAVYNAQTNDLLATLDLEPDVRPGLYGTTWEITTSCLSVPLGLEATLTDPVSTLASDGGANPDGWDLQLQFIRPNTPPRFTNPTAADTYVSIVMPSYLDIPFAAVDDEGDAISYAVEHSADLDVQLDVANGRLRVTGFPEVPCSDTHIHLVATDSWGASAGVAFSVNFSWSASGYAFLVDYDSIWLNGDSKQLTIGGGSLSEHPQYAWVDVRAQDATDWTRLGQATYSRWDNTTQCYLADFTWSLPDDGATAYELRLTLVSSEGVEDSDPPVYHFERTRQGGGVTAIEAPTTVLAGSLFTVRVHIENGSTTPWSRDAGFGLLPLDSVDPLTGLTGAQFMAVHQIERGDSSVVEILARAPSAPGQYRTAWQMGENSTPFGSTAEAFTWVVANGIDPLTGLSATQNYHIASDGHFWLGAFDYTTGQWAATLDATGDDTLSYDLPEKGWLSTYLYDYASSSWASCLHLYRD